MSKKLRQFWIVYSYHFRYMGDAREFHYLKYLHNDRVFMWSSNVGEAHCFVSKKKAEQMAIEKGGKVDIHPRCRYE